MLRSCHPTNKPWKEQATPVAPLTEGYGRNAGSSRLSWGDIRGDEGSLGLCAWTQGAREGKGWEPQEFSV